MTYMKPQMQPGPLGSTPRTSDRAGSASVCLPVASDEMQQVCAETVLLYGLGSLGKEWWYAEK